MFSSESYFTEAKEPLDKRFGDPYVIQSAFRDELEGYPKIPSRDSAALRKYSDFLRQCLAASKVIPCMDSLSDVR